jgi:hypothetical protein
MNRLVIALALLTWTTVGAAAQIPIPPKPQAWPMDKNISYGDRYGFVSFQFPSMDLPAQKTWLTNLVQNLFGVNSNGEYLIALELIDNTG